MSDLYWLTGEQMMRLQPYFLKSQGKQRVDDRPVLKSIVFVNAQRLCTAQACHEQLCDGTAILVFVVSDHGVERDEKPSHGGDDRKLDGFAGFAHPTVVAAARCFLPDREMSAAR